MTGLLKGLTRNAPITLSLMDNPFNNLTPQHVLLTGGTGFIGSLITSQLLAAHHKVTLLTRFPEKAKTLLGPNISVISQLNELASLPDVDCVINLAGKQIVGLPWSQKQKNKLIESRLNITTQLVSWFKQCPQKPQLVIQASAIGFYGVRDGDEILTEESLTGQGFMAELCQIWEEKAQLLSDDNTRLVTFRLGVVFGQGGALPKLALPFYFGVGGKLGDGKQILSWVHREDVSRAFAFAMTNSTVNGTYNLVAPETISQQNFASTLGKYIKRPSFFPMPKLVLTSMLGEMADVFVGGQNVSSAKLQASGFSFNHPTVIDGLRATSIIC
ncbi:TIGR01777 family oxidoreductase [Thorsellia kenyensis]|uniref:TIGR01777 family oxidoreductase n=1 Tax=Thorsellia kenyensis TaxID=1549888 RepID=A0ABV6CB76_9GAMM